MPSYGWTVKDPEKFMATLIAGIHAMGDEVFTQSQRDVPVDKGTLKKSGTLIKTDMGFRIIYRTSYAARQEFGVEPGTVEKVKRHEVRKHNRMIRPAGRKRRKKVTVREHQRGPYTRTFPRGIPGRFYLSNAWEQSRPRLTQFITSLARRS